MTARVTAAAWQTHHQISWRHYATINCSGANNFMFEKPSVWGNPRARPPLSRANRAVTGLAVSAVLAISLGALPALADDVTPTSAPSTTATSSATPAAVETPLVTPVASPAATPSASPSVAAPLSIEPSATPEPIREPAQEATPPTSGLGARMGQGMAKIEAAAPKIPSAFSAQTYASPAGVYGMDISGWQADAGTHSVSQIDWNQHWAMGSRFAYAKATEGTNFVDASRASHLAGANRVGMLQGAYHFALPGMGSAISQADFFINNGGGWQADGKTLPPLLDIEYNPYSSLGNTCYNFSPSAMVQWIRDFSNRVNTRTGRLPMIYTTTDWWARCTGNSGAFTEQPLHIAAYSSQLGAIPSGWGFHSVWQYSDSGPFAGDSNLWNGSLEGLKAFAGLPPAPKPIPKPVPVPLVHSIMSAADIVAADGAGILWNYPANRSGALAARKQIGQGWQGLRSINVTDWNADGVFDIIAQWKNGQVTTYLGVPGGGFRTGPVLASSGWAENTLTVGPWISSSKYPQIISRSSSGALTLWSNPSGAGLGSSRSIGNGWGSLDTVMIDFDGNGTQDIVARNSAGDLMLYRSDGNGNFISQDRPKIGSGWGSMTSLTVASGFTAGYSSGIVARTNTGGLLYYPTNGQNGFSKTITMGSGWSGMLIAGGENLAQIKAPAPVNNGPVASSADALSIGNDGKLFVHKATASGNYQKPVEIGYGFGAFRAVQVVDFDNDGVQDVLAQRTDKSLSVYFGNRAGGFSGSKVVAAAGWTGKDIVAGKWKNTDKYPGVISTDSDGRLLYWPNTNGTSLGSPEQIGNGWGSLKVAMVDFDLNGTQDLLAVNGSGGMLLYRGTGTGGFVYQDRPTVGQGWGAMKAFRGIASPAGVNALMGGNELRFYPIAAPGAWGLQRSVVKPMSGAVMAP